MRSSHTHVHMHTSHKFLRSTSMVSGARRPSLRRSGSRAPSSWQRYAASYKPVDGRWVCVGNMRSRRDMRDMTSMRRQT